MFNERAEVVDDIPNVLLDLLLRQVTLFPSFQNTLVRFSGQYAGQLANQPHQISVVEALDGAEVIWSALEAVRAGASNSTDTSRGELDTTSKAGCLHKWAIMPARGPASSEDIIRAMKCLMPVLNWSLHKRKGNKET